MTATRTAAEIAEELATTAEKLAWNQRNLASALDRYTNHQDRDGGPDTDELGFIEFMGKLTATKAARVAVLAAELAIAHLTEADEAARVIPPPARLSPADIAALTAYSSPAEPAPADPTARPSRNPATESLRAAIKARRANV